MVGTGKTVVAAWLAKHLPDLNIAVLCPKSVIPSWERELEEWGVTPLFVLNYEKIRTGNTRWLSKIGKKTMSWKVPEDTLVLFDEVHKCKGPFTQNAQLLISAVQQGIRVHMMSATSAEDPTEMRAIGFALGLHNLNRPLGDLKSWFSWMANCGCERNDWNGWEFRGSRAKLGALQKALYDSPNKRAAKLLHSDLPDAFRENMVFVEPIQFSSATKIKRAYDEAGITPKIIEDYIVNGTVGDNDNILVDMLRARQLAESCKIPEFAEFASEAMDEGMSPVLFVSFNDTVDALADLLKCDVIRGSQSKAKRQEAIDNFQMDRTRCLVANTQAGGTGLSLHDVRGERPRIAFISPQFSAKDHLQCLGRIHRNGAKSDAVQKILVAAGTIEEDVLKAIQSKTKNMQALHGD